MDPRRAHHPPGRDLRELVRADRPGGGLSSPFRPCTPSCGSLTPLETPGAPVCSLYPLPLPQARKQTALLVPAIPTLLQLPSPWVRPRGVLCSPLFHPVAMSQEE